MKKSSEELLDQIEELPLNSGDIAVEQAEEVDPNQITLEQAIDEAIDTVEEAKEIVEDVLEETEKLLSPTEWKAEDSETGDSIELDEDAQEALNEALNTYVNEDGETLKETFDKELEEEKEEEIEMDDDTFEL